MQITSYLSFGGNCEDAFTCYAELLGGKIEVMIMFDDMAAKMGASEEWRSKVMHAELVFGDQLVMGTDEPPARRKPPQGMWLTLCFTDLGEAQRIFDALAQDGNITMKLQKTFFRNIHFGQLTDRFGTPWMFRCEPEDG